MMGNNISYWESLTCLKCEKQVFSKGAKQKPENDEWLGGSVFNIQKNNSKLYICLCDECLEENIKNKKIKKQMDIQYPGAIKL